MDREKYFHSDLKADFDDCEGEEREDTDSCYRGTPPRLGIHPRTRPSACRVAQQQWYLT